MKSIDSKTIVWLCSEAVPFAKSGGLADVSGALPTALAARGHNVFVIMPYYPKLMGDYNWKLKVRHANLGVPLGTKTRWAQILELKFSDRLTFLFIEHHDYFDRPELYESGGRDFSDNAERFIFLSRAAMQAILALKLKPDIIHANDWHTALACVYLKSHLYKDLPNFSKCASVLTIHNIAYQGNFSKSLIQLTGLGWEYFNFHCLEFYDNICLLKGGIMMAHMLNTVSPAYALETLSPQFGFSLDSPLRERAFHGAYRGILNGIDTENWNPETDNLIPKNFSDSDMSGKKICKKALQKEFSLPISTSTPLLGIVSRLAYQKGIDVFASAAEEMLKYDDVQFVILGTGEPWLQSKLQHLATTYPAKFAVRIGFSDKTAHMIEAGSDLFVMPSRYEPCGLNQMYSMRYGTAPIVRATGGLDDTVKNFSAENPGDSTGFKFWELYPQALLGTMRWAASVFRDQKKSFAKMRGNMMKQDFSWDSTASKYEELYEDAINRL